VNWGLVDIRQWSTITIKSAANAGRALSRKAIYAFRLPIVTRAGFDDALLGADQAVRRPVPSQSRIDTNG
jgi:hypothetical protein